ncbi:calcium:proton antiporter [Methylocystis sp.]|jgi:Ca2+:H+ antiporter|uniref:calcium:proton antiporter n=1 Tax=Methylocystis sp. TaxID=1911079 RepID=UPI0011DB05CF|nr:ionic transporter [Methylocystis sp.]KAF0210139.1 MAG: Sodium/calcium exchanger membrane [Methylocystaceae bacterium]MDP3555108.1 ionic transporter [Methylocystis sp.]TXT43764.1 MAG: Sodium/calcium exchanger membrane region [Methylocystaceae bacterium]
MQAARITVGAVLFPALALGLAGVFLFGERWISQVPASIDFVPPTLAAVLLIGAVFAALQHAEILGAKTGEPYGTLVLTIAVTVIEVAIMASMIEHGDEDPTEAREAVFSAIIIVCNGLVGLCLLLGGFRHHEQEIQPMATSAYLAILIALSVLTLILPDYTTSSYGPTLSTTQLIFVSVLSVLLYGAFLFIQTVRHRSYFIDVHVAAVGHGEAKPSRAVAIFAVAGLGASLLGVSLLAERVIPGLEEALRWGGVDDVNRVTGAAVAMLVLLPESMNSIRAATRNALQTSLNGALGSVVATIGLTVPAVALLSVATNREIVFGLEKRDTVLLLLTLLLSVVSFGAGRTNLMTGLVHLVVFATYIFLLFVP